MGTDDNPRVQLWETLDRMVNGEADSRNQIVSAMAAEAAQREGQMGRNSGKRDGERDRVVELLNDLLTPAVCRRLGIYQWPSGFLLSVIIPVFNEQATIEPLIRKVQSVDVPCEIIVVDDASTDGTREILQSLGESRRTEDYLSSTESR